MNDCTGTAVDRLWMDQAVELALETERAGNLPIAALLVLGSRCIAAAGSEIVAPVYHPGRHAEIQALGQVPEERWPQAARMTCYTTLEPCLMCMGALLLHGIGRVVFGAWDLVGGSTDTLTQLPAYYAKGRGIPEWIGPILPERCDPLYQRANALYSNLPCGHHHGLPTPKPTHLVGDMAC